jgi:chromosome partitioning protein
MRFLVLRAQGKMSMDEPSDLVGVFEEHADLADTVQRRINEIDNKPECKKTFQILPSRQAALLLGISESYLRKLVLETEQLPKGQTVGAGRRGFALEEVNTIRHYLLAHTRDPRYQVGRDQTRNDKLQVMTVCNFKGGAAKTTTAVHLAQYLSLRGYRILIVDLDSQASATGLLGFHADEEFAEEDTLYGYMRGTVSKLSTLIRPTYMPGLDLIPANLGLYRVEFELPARQIRETDFRFWRLLAQAMLEINSDYDVVICDCPPRVCGLWATA